MKKFIEITVQIKFIWGIFFTTAMLLYTTINMILGHTSMEFITVWQIVAISIVLVFLYYIIFGEYILRFVSIKNKILIHFPLNFVALLISACILNWIDISKFNSLIIFAIGYTCIYLLCINSFYIYYKVTGEELNDRLTAYKEKKNIN